MRPFSGSRQREQGEIPLLLVVLPILGNEKTLKPRSSCPEGQDKLQHHSSVPG